MIVIIAALALTALYCGGMWGFLAFLTFRDGTNYERETFHLGLCFILAIGFLGLILRAGGA